MTRAYNDRREEYTAGAGQTTFAYGWRLDNITDMRVFQEVFTTKVVTELFNPADYTVTGVGVVSGGNMVLNSGAAVNDEIVIYGERDPERIENYLTSGDIPAATLNADIDVQADMVMEINRDVLRSLSLAPITPNSVSTVLPDPVAGEAWRWNPTATAVEHFTPLSDVGDDVALCFGADNDYCIVYDSAADALEIRDEAATALVRITDSDNIFLNPITVPDGTAAAPGLRVATDPTGLYLQGGGILGFSANGVQAANLSVAAGFVVVGPIVAGTNLTLADGVLQIKEQAAADANIAAFGQLWIRNDIPNTFVFTDDVGTDHIVGGATVLSGSGTLNAIPLWTPDGDTLGDSLLTQPTAKALQSTHETVLIGPPPTTAVDVVFSVFNQGDSAGGFDSTIRVSTDADGEGDAIFAAAITGGAGQTYVHGTKFSDLDYHFSVGAVLGTADAWVVNGAGFVTFPDASGVAITGAVTCNAITMTTGNLQVTSGTITASSNVDSTHIFGRAKLGSPSTDVMCLAHFDRLSNNECAIRQDSAGVTIVGTPLSQSVNLAVNNTNKVTVTNTLVSTSVDFSAPEGLFGNGGSTSAAIPIHAHSATGCIVQAESDGVNTVGFRMTNTAGEYQIGVNSSNQLVLGEIGGNDSVKILTGATLNSLLVNTASITMAVPLNVEQPSASGAVPVLVLTQDDIDDTFVNFVGTSAADSTRSISSSSAEAAAKTGAYRAELNGVTGWIRVYASAV